MRTFDAGPHDIRAESSSWFLPIGFDKPREAESGDLSSGTFLENGDGQL
jgi:hypothetical protein